MTSRLLLAFLFFFHLGVSAQTSVDQSGFVRIGGIEQWVSIKGADVRNPVILMVHGGPGNPMSPYADAVFAGWTKDYTLVQWDQRGAGRTFGRNPAEQEKPLSIEQMAQDGVEVAAHAAKAVGQQKVILMGGSWGSTLAVHMAQARPDLFHTYIGSAQLVNGQENQARVYARALALARSSGNAKAVAALEGIGAPPWTNPRNNGIMRRNSRPLEGLASQPAPREWWKPAAGFDTPAAQAEYEAGEDYSFIQFVGMKGDGILSRLDLHKLGTTFRMPVYLFHGEHDLVTDQAVARRYFDAIDAPKKEFIVLPNSGHDPNPEWLQAHVQLLARLRPTLR